MPDFLTALSADLHLNAIWDISDEYSSYKKALLNSSSFPKYIRNIPISGIKPGALATLPPKTTRYEQGKKRGYGLTGSRYMLKR